MARDIAKRDFFTLDNFKVLNGEGYNKKDVRTYKMPPLSRTPESDIYIHMSLPDKPGDGHGSVRTNQGTFLGCPWEHTDGAARRAVLHFPKASSIDVSKGLVQIDRKQVPNLYPSWMITRYGRENLPENLTLRHDTTFYLAKSEKKFLYFFDEAFLDELDPDLLTDGVDTACFRIYRDKNRRRFLALASRDFSDFDAIGDRLKQDNPIAVAWSRIQDNYCRLTIDAQKLEKVIVIKSKRDQSPDRISPLTPESLDNASISLAFGLAARHNNTYYWIDENGEINTRVQGEVIRYHAQKTGLLGSGLMKETSATIVIPYSEDDWNALVAIKKRLDEVQDSLWNLITGCQAGDNGIDHSLSDGLKAVDSPKLLGLEGQ